MDADKRRAVMNAIHEALADACEKGTLWHVGRTGPHDTTEFVVFSDELTHFRVAVNLDDVRP